MQIKYIVLYKNKFEPRIVEFFPGELNIITGESKSGKTAIIDIVNYCLGSSNCEVKGDKIIYSVEWFAVVLQLSEMQVFVARQNPYFLRQETTNDIHFSFEREIVLPQYEDLRSNSNIGALVEFLSEKLEIRDNLNVPPSLTRESLVANFRHARLFCYQPQNVIAEFKYLFFNQDSSWVEQAMIDTLPYFLGAVRDDELVVKGEIRDITRRLNRLGRRRTELESLQVQGQEGIDIIVEEALELGLVAPEILSLSLDNKTKILKDLTSGGRPENLNMGENERLSELLEDKESLRRELGGVSTEIKATEHFIENSGLYSVETSHQQARLLSLGLYKQPSDNKVWNALIGDYTDTIPPLLEQLNASLERLNDNLSATQGGTPKFTAHLDSLKVKYRNLLDQLGSIDVKIEAIYSEQAKLEELRSRNIRIGRVLGKIELILSSQRSLEDDSSLVREIAALEAQKLELVQRISLDAQEEILDSAISFINRTMSTWTDKISFEYPNAHLRFSRKKLTVFVETENGTLPLNRLGGAENWLACHIIVHLALHKFFLENRRPIPRFVIFDQPTQVHYPDKYVEMPGEYAPSQDEAADIRLFSFLMEFVKSSYPDFQIIVTDHAHFHYPEFERCVREVWRGGRKLVPEEWL